MLSIKLKAAEIKKILTADTPEKAQIALVPVVEAIKTAEVAKTFGKPAKEAKLTYKRAHEILRGVLDNLITPAAPDGKFFAQVNRAISLHGMDEEYVQNLAEYCRDNMGRRALNVDFVLCQAPRILAGEWAVSKPTASTPAPKPKWRQDYLPED